jgi:hypothetical protein
MAKSKAADSMYRFFSSKGRAAIPRARTFQNFSPEEIFQLLQLVNGRDAHDAVAYANVCRSSSRKVTVEDVEQVANMLNVKEVQES